MLNILNSIFKCYLIIFFCLFSFNSNALFKMGVDGVLYGFGQWSTKSHLVVSFGNDNFSLGPFAHYENMNGKHYDSILGLSLIKDGDLSFEISGGVVKERAYIFKNEGIAIMLIIRKKISDMVRFSFTSIFRDINKGNDIRTTLKFYPMLGLWFSW